jgi:hypothetical protein
MSDIKMCDNCGEIFSTNTDNWVQYASQQTAVSRESSHPVVVSQKTLHMCGNCNKGAAGQLTPRLPAQAIEDVQR